MKLKRLMAIASLSLILVGCSKSSSNITMEKGVVMFDGKPSIVDRFTGNAAEVKLGNDKYEVKYTEAPVLANADGNDKGIDESNMTKFKDALYFTLYLDTYLTMYKKVGDGKYIYVQTGSESTPKDSMVQQAYNVLEQTPVTGDSKFKVKTDGGFTIKAPDGVELQAFKNKVSVKNNMQVTYGEDPNCTNVEDVDIGGKVVGMKTFTTSTYKFYAYNGYTIQTVLGVNLSDYIEID